MTTEESYKLQKRCYTLATFFATCNARTGNYKCQGTLEFMIILPKKKTSVQKFTLKEYQTRKVRKYNSSTPMLCLFSFEQNPVLRSLLPVFFSPRKLHESQTKIEPDVCHEGIGPNIGLDSAINRARVEKYMPDTAFPRAKWYRDRAGGKSSPVCELKPEALVIGC